MEYKILTASTAAELQDAVNDHLLHMWRLHGSIAVIVNSATGEETYIQPVVR